MNWCAVRIAPIVLGLLLAGSGFYTRTGSAQSASPAALASPEKFFGFQLGAGRQLAGTQQFD